MFEFSPKQKAYLSKSVLVFMSLLCLFLITRIFSGAHSYDHNEHAGDQHTIVVSGSGEAYAKADMATVSFTIENTAGDVKSAQTKTTDSTNKAIDFLKTQNIQESDIQTTSYNVSPQYSYDRGCYSYPCPPVQNPKITGYQVSNTIEVKVRAIDTVGDVLKGLGDLGITQLYGPNFGLADDDAVKSEARTNAIMHAREQAESIADALHVHLGRVISFTENSSPMPMYFSEAKALSSADSGSAPAPTIAPGENKVTSDVSVTYEIR